MFTVAGLFPLKPVMLLMPCHMLLGLLLLNCSSTLFLYCRFYIVAGIEKPASSMAESGTIADIQVSVRQITQHSLVSRWYEMRARSSQSLLSSD